MPSESLLSLSAEAVEAYPNSSELQRLRGDLLSVHAEWDDAIRQQAMACYRRALAIAPNCIEALEGLGYCHDVLEQLDEAEDVFRRALSFGGSPASYAGLARVLRQKGDKATALQLLSPDTCPFHDDPLVTSRRDEILAGDWAPFSEASEEVSE